MSYVVVYVFVIVFCVLSLGFEMSVYALRCSVACKRLSATGSIFNVQPGKAGQGLWRLELLKGICEFCQGKPRIWDSRSSLRNAALDLVRADCKPLGCSRLSSCLSRVSGGFLTISVPTSTAKTP